MCVCKTAIRRRRQLAMDKRYKKRSPEASARRNARAKEMSSRLGKRA